MLLRKSDATAPGSAWQRLSGKVFSAGEGSLNLVTGTFTRTGAASNQLVTYGTDMATMAMVRAAPGIANPPSRP